MNKIVSRVYLNAAPSGRRDGAGIRGRAKEGRGGALLNYGRGSATGYDGLFG